MFDHFLDCNARPFYCSLEIDERCSFVIVRSEYAEVNDDSPLFSIDCEMCLTNAGSELTKSVDQL